jgi:hypothetical protein
LSEEIKRNTRKTKVEMAVLEKKTWKPALREKKKKKLQPIYLR